MTKLLPVLLLALVSPLAMAQIAAPIQTIYCDDDNGTTMALDSIAAGADGFTVTGHKVTVTSGNLPTLIHDGKTFDPGGDDEMLANSMRYSEVKIPDGTSVVLWSKLDQEAYHDLEIQSDISKQSWTEYWNNTPPAARKVYDQAFAEKLKIYRSRFPALKSAIEDAQKSKGCENVKVVYARGEAVTLKCDRLTNRAGNLDWITPTPIRSAMYAGGAPTQAHSAIGTYNSCNKFAAPCTVNP